mgnify:CR=1 FL=1
MTNETEVNIENLDSNKSYSSDSIKVLKGLDVTLFPDQGKYHEWKKKAEEIGLKCEISIEAEEWYEKGLIGKGDAIDDYYINLAKKVNSKIVKTDPEWDQREYDSIFFYNK